jgi:serine/threonine-protein kinase HipA
VIRYLHRDDDVNTLTYLLESSSDRIGAIDFQSSPTEYIPRDSETTLDEMLVAAERLESGEPLSHNLDLALLHATSAGGARPKMVLDDKGRKLIAKLSRPTDSYPVVKAEAVSMELARRAGLEVPATSVVHTVGRDVLLVERFDRTAMGGRRSMVSALTIFELDEMAGRYGTYWGLARKIRERFTAPEATLRELFSRITFNICMSNTDDHVRNHSAFWDGHRLSLTPAYDICPQLRSGGEAVQAMEIGDDRWRNSQLAGCVDRCGLYGLSRTDATGIVDHQIDVINAEWEDASDAARLTLRERDMLWGRQVLNPYCLYDYAAGSSVMRVASRSALAASAGIDRCGATTRRGLPCKKSANCPHHRGGGRT